MNSEHRTQNIEFGIQNSESRIRKRRYSGFCLLDSVFVVFLLFTIHFSLSTVVHAMESRTVVVAKVFIKRGQEIKCEDVALKEMELPRFPADVVTNVEFVAGKTAKRDIRQGMPIRAGLLESKKLVKRGEPVTIVAEAGSLRVTAIGQAVEDGGEGELVKVLNLGSKKMVVGRVTGDSTVSIPF
jgi:flagella basal body P-ring formation protein FlgA